MKNFNLRNDFLFFSLTVVAYAALICPVRGLAQSADFESLRARLEQLEQRQTALELENQQLRAQIISLAGAVLHKEMTVPIHQAALQTAGPTTAPQASAARPPVEAPPQRVQFGGEIRFRPETRSSFRSDVAVNTILYQRIRLDARLRLNDNVTGLIQMQDSRLWGQEASTGSNEGNMDLHQGYIQVANFLAPALTLRVGRQEISYGNQRLIGAFGWDNVGRSFDAGKLTYMAARWTADLFAARLVDRRNSGRGDGSQDLIGLYGRVGQPNSTMGLEPYLLYLRDGLELAGEKSGVPRESTQILTLGFRTFRAVPGGFSYDLENAFQVGQRGPDTHRAAALAAQARYRFGGSVKPEVGFEYDYSTGDGKSTDGQSQEFNNLFPPTILTTDLPIT
jgi:hypothetical protein